MEFCPRCKSVLLPENREGNVVFVCSQCGAQVSDVSSKTVKVFGESEPSVLVTEKKKPAEPRQEE